ncbi:hypothetical protein NMG60_11008219 [Bertholletia excelsa]
MKNNGYATPSSSPPTPPSPLPVSVGPGSQNYFFYSSPSPSPPFSPPPSSHTSAENLPLLRYKRSNSGPVLAFSLDRPINPRRQSPSRSSSCLSDWLEWVVLRCCSICSSSAS